MSEVRLSEYNVPKLETIGAGSSNSGKDEVEDLVEEADDGLLIKYNVLDVFEGNSGDIEEDESDWDGEEDEGEEDEDDEEDYSDEIEDADEVLGFDGGKIVNAFDIQGKKVTAKLYAFDDDEDKFGSEKSSFEGKIGEISEEGEEGVKEKGVPAVMRCFDRAKIFVKAGDGGNGVVAFRREKFVPLGGPSGGDGGRGGNIYVEVDGSMNSLLPFRNSVHFRAGRGGHGQGSKMGGAKGEDVVVMVAPGTVVREADKEEVLLELLHPGQRALLLPGGRGGRGNASFKSGMNKAPRIAENGEAGAEM